MNPAAACARQDGDWYMSSRLASARMKGDPEVVLNALASEDGPTDLKYASATLKNGGMARYIRTRLQAHMAMVFATVSQSASARTHRGDSFPPSACSVSAPAARSTGKSKARADASVKDV